MAKTKTPCVAAGQELGGAAGEEGGLPAGGARRPEPWGIDDVERLLGLELEVIRLQQALQILQVWERRLCLLLCALAGGSRSVLWLEGRALHFAGRTHRRTAVGQSPSWWPAVCWGSGPRPSPVQLEFESRSELVEALEGRLRAAQREAAVGG